MENNHCYETACPEGKEKKEIACTKKSDCSYIMIKGDTNSTKEADCKCTKLGEQYCEYPSLSDEWKNYVSVVAKEIEGYKVRTYKVDVARQSDYLLSEKIREAKIKANIEFYKAPTCLIDALSSGNIEVQFGVIALLLAILI